MSPAIFLIPLVATYRIVMAWQMSMGPHVPAPDSLAGWLPGFCPLSAVALCAGAFLPRRLVFAVPLLTLAASDVIIDMHYSAPFFTGAMLARYALLGMICALGLLLRRGGSRPGVGTTVLTTAAASTFFYVASNTFAWMGAAEYPQTAAGWVQALTTGLPGYLPSWYFYRNALVSDCLYTMVFVACLARDAALRPAGRGGVPARHGALGTVPLR